MAHTPGLYEAIPPAKVGKHWMVGVRGVVGGKRVLWIVARIENGKPGDTLDTERDNAKLFAASPKMLRVLKNVISSCPSEESTDPAFWPIVEDCRAIMAELEGR